MTTDRDFDRIARAWLDLMPDEVPDRTIDDALRAVEMTSQARRPLVRLPRRFDRYERPALIAAAALLGVAVIGGALLVGGRQDSPPPAPTPTPSPSSVQQGVDDGLRSTWIADAAPDPDLGTGGGPVYLTVSPSGTTIASRNFGSAGSYASSLRMDGSDGLHLTLDRAVGACAAGVEGTYRWALSPDRSLLELDVVSDPCAARATEFARTWVRSLLEPTMAGSGVVDSMDPIFAITLPDRTYEARTLDDFVEIVGSDGSSLMVFKNLQGFANPCAQPERYPYTAGADALVDYFRQNDAFTILETSTLTIDGHRAVHLVTEASSDYAACPDQDLLMYTPKDCDCHFVAGPGLRDSFYLVEVGSDTFMFELSPPMDAASEAPIIQSIRIPTTLPSTR
jgi:hypothetical protein